MRTILLFLLCCACSLGLPGQQIKLMWYNVRNYNLEDRLTPEGYKTNYPKPEKEKAALIEVIAAENPDVLVVCEMGPASFLKEFQGRLQSAGLAYPHTYLAQAQDPKRRLALLSRLPFRSSSSWPLSFKYKHSPERQAVLRGLLEAQFTVEEKTFHLYAVHLKSRLTQTDADPLCIDYRTGEANTLREVILQKTPPETTPYLILGDFNDTPRSSALKRFMQKGSRSLATPLELRDTRGQTWTHAWEAEDSYTRIDYALVSPALAPAVVAAGSRVVDDPSTKVASDHRPLVITLDMGKLATP